MKGFFYFIFIIFLSVESYPQESIIKFNHLKEGLSQSSITCILQDRKGFMWFGTRAGLDQFNGYEFVIYKNIPGDTNSLSSNRIQDIYEDESGDLWIATDDGINLMKKGTNKFKQYLKNKYILKIFEDSKGDLWIGTAQELCKFNKKDKSYIQFKYDNINTKTLSNSTVYIIHEDHKHNLWVGTSDGQMNLYNPDKKCFTRLKSSKVNPVGLVPRFRCIVEDEDGKIWVGTQNTGLLCIESYTSDIINYIQFLHNEKDNNSLSINNVMSLLLDSKNNLWIGTENGGLDILNLKTKTFKHYKNDPNDNTTLCSNSLWSIYQDTNERIWIGTYNNGLSIIDKYYSKFTTYCHQNNNINSLNNNSVLNFLEDQKSNIWIATDGGGLDYFDCKIRSFVHTVSKKNDKNSLSNNALMSLYMDFRGEIWIGTWGGGISVFSKDKQYFRHYNVENNTVTSNYIHNIIGDNEGNIYIATHDKGLNIFERKTNRFIYITHNDSDFNSLSVNFLNSLFCDSKNQIWVSTTGNGLDLMKKNVSGQISFVHYHHDVKNPNSISNNSIVCMYEDHLKNLWIGTNNGLNLMNRDKVTFTVFYEKDGLPSNNIKGIVEDNNGNLWISTLKGISKFNLKTKKFRNYDISDGLQGNEFNENSVFKASNGELYFGGQQGFSVFQPDSIYDNPFIPPVYITDLKIFNKSVSVDTKDSPLKTFINETNKIKLSYKQSIFSFDFVALNYSHPDKNQYAYILEGFENDWNYIKKRQTVTYTNIDPGNYTFKVKGSNNDGIWNETGTSIEITILPPWWKTWWFRILMIAVLIIALVGLYLNRIKKFRKRQKELEKIVYDRTKELEEINQSLEEKQEEINLQKEELETQKNSLQDANEVLLDQQKHITEQNKELNNHRNELESLVVQRTQELEVAKSKAEVSDRLKSAFLANMSHEIRTPMNSIVGFSNLLCDENLNNEDKKSFADIIVHSSESLLVLINDILDISKIQAGQLVLTYKPINLDDLLNKLYETFLIETDKNNLKFSLANKTLLPKIWVETDEVRLIQVFSNLISNAIKFTDAGSIEFGIAEQQKNMIVFFVKDTGIGIPPEFGNSIFEIFSKIENNRTKQIQGAGLGLAISKSLINLMGGEIWYESLLNKGTTFFFSIPLIFVKDVKIKSLQTNNQSIQFPDLAGKTILIAEDEENNFKLIAAILKKTKANIIWAKNGLEAIELFQQNPSIDLILMDIKMPLIDGIEANKKIKQLKKEVIIVAQTAFAYEDDVKEFVDSGFDAYIIKPIKMQELINILKKFFV